jgi:hypothetical protein
MTISNAASQAASIPGLNLGAGQFGTPPQVSDPAAALAAVSSQSWQTYLQHFVPYENTLIQYAMNPNQVATNMQTAEQLQGSANQMATGNETRRLQQMDVSLTPEQQATQNRTRGISDALSTVTAANQAKDVTVANQMGIAGMPMSGITGNI